METYWVAVVDDEAISLTYAKKILSEQNIKTSCLKSGRMLLKFMENHSPDLILLDILMPEMDGFDTFSLLRKMEDDQGRHHTPVIFLTGENDSETESKGLVLGASDFIKKPFNKDILLRRINNSILNSKTIVSLREDAALDKLTGLLNKSGGTDLIRGMCEKNSGAVLIFDIDNFKLINDIYGHNKGDSMLVAFADILKKRIRSKDAAARIGGDEFLAFFCGISNENDILALSNRLNADIINEAKRLLGEDFDIPLGISTGCAMVPENGRDFKTLFILADDALYNVKQNGKHGYAVYKKETGNSGSDSDSLEAELLRITQIVEEREGSNGALVLGKDAFITVYRYSRRIAVRYSGNAMRFLFSLTLKDGADTDKFSYGTDEFCKILQRSLRKTDIILRNKPNQYFLLLPGLQKSDSTKVLDRIMTGWRQTAFADCINVRFVIEEV